MTHYQQSCFRPDSDTYVIKPFKLQLPRVQNFFRHLRFPMCFDLGSMRTNTEISWGFIAVVLLLLFTGLSSKL